ncbi:helix-turn-helix transcriptional regulator [Arthrobacter sp. ISL-30]|uniref:ArsR/SmtB family transcription factor n=1 Tax=Arthrobacter sp. ISL-30 TaxID=2819109 RepID=UPI001BE5B3F5|nr:metalloregulator ArsR/SmtB family transcription factor [Arthrobacter sp. ISL-30]MBT2515053.1 winged helix-turn-helix transcriptional regulator [Arthrobacter sp. ISL-30]
MVTDDVFAVIAEATRRDILVSLRSGDKAVGELVEELSASQPTISKHLKVLREADLVSMRAQGQKRYYALNTKPLAGIASWLETFDVGPAASKGAAAEAASPEEAVAGNPEPAVAAAVQSAGIHSAPEVATIPGDTVSVLAIPDDTMPQQIGRSVGRAATRAADILANLPKVPNLSKVPNLPKVPNLSKFGRKR